MQTNDQHSEELSKNFEFNPLLPLSQTPLESFCRCPLLWSTLWDLKWFWSALHDGSSISKNFSIRSKLSPLTSWEIFCYVSWFPVVFLIRGASSFCNSYLINFCGMKVLEKIRIEVFTKIQHLPISFFQKHKSGDLFSRVTADTTQLQAAVLSVSNDLIRQPITFIGAITALVVMAIQREGMTFVLLCLMAVPLCVFPIRKVGALLMTKALSLQRQAGDLSSVLSETYLVLLKYALLTYKKEK